MDAFVNALGELYFGAGQGCKDMLYFSIGSGFSSGLISGGRLVTGYKNMGGQCGFYSINGLQDPPAGRHIYGEEILSGYGIRNLARNYLDENRYPATRLTRADLSTQSLIAAAQAGAPLASGVFGEAARVLGIVLSAYLAFVSPKRVVIGGGLGIASFNLLLPLLKRELQGRIPEDYTCELEIAVSTLRCSAAGPACLVFQQLGLPYYSGC
jgi:glucokinase